MRGDGRASSRRLGRGPRLRAVAAACVVGAVLLAGCGPAGAGPARPSTVASVSSPTGGAASPAAPSRTSAGASDAAVVFPEWVPTLAKLSVRAAGSVAAPVWVAGGDWSASLVAVSPSAGRAVSVTNRPGSVCWISQAAGTVWVVTDLGVNSTANVVSRVDARSGRELAHGTAGGRVSGLASAGGRLWLTVGSEIVALDPMTLHRVAVVATPEPLTALASDGAELWGVGVRSNTLLGIDPGSGAVVVRRPLGFSPPEVGGVVVAGRHLWVADGSGNRVLEIDPGTGRVLGTVGLGTATLTDPAFAQTPNVKVNVMGMVRVGDRLWVYHLRTAGHWELVPVGVSSATVAGPGVPMPSIGLCGAVTDGRDLWFGWLPPNPSDVGIFKADLRRRTVTRVAGLSHNDTYDLTLTA